MWMVIAHHVADDLGTFAIGFSGDESALLARIENAAMNGFQAIAYVRQSARYDHTHRVIEIARLHLINNIDGANVRWTGRGRLVVAQSVTFQYEIFMETLAKLQESSERKA